jgi:hypothetical protein
MTYAQMLDVPFAYSSNGDAFFEHDFLTGQERQLALSEFPSLDELVARYHAGKGLNDQEKRDHRPALLHQPGRPMRRAIIRWMRLTALWMRLPEDSSESSLPWQPVPVKRMSLSRPYIAC